MCSIPKLRKSPYISGFGALEQFLILAPISQKRDNKEVRTEYQADLKPRFDKLKRGLKAISVGVSKTRPIVLD